MTRPLLRLVPPPEQAASLPGVPPPGSSNPSEHYHGALKGTDLYPVRTLAGLWRKARAWEVAGGAGACPVKLAAIAEEYTTAWCAAEFERTGITPPAPSPDASAPQAIAPTSSPDAQELPLDVAAPAVTLAPFIERTRAELAGAYCRPLPWPDGGALVHNPAEHCATHGARFPAGLADVLARLAGAWEAGDRPADDWPAAPVLYQWEYSRLVAWFKADPGAVPAQLEAWEGTVTKWGNPLVYGRGGGPVAPVPEETRDGGETHNV